MKSNSNLSPHFDTGKQLFIWVLSCLVMLMNVTIPCNAAAERALPKMVTSYFVILDVMIVGNAYYTGFYW